MKEGTLRTKLNPWWEKVKRQYIFYNHHIIPLDAQNLTQQRIPFCGLQNATEGSLPKRKENTTATNKVQAVTKFIHNDNDTHHGDLRDHDGSKNSLVRNLVQKVVANIGDRKEGKLRTQHTWLKKTPGPRSPLPIISTAMSQSHELDRPTEQQMLFNKTPDPPFTTYINKMPQHT